MAIQIYIATLSWPHPLSGEGGGRGRWEGVSQHYIGYLDITWSNFSPVAPHKIFFLYNKLIWKILYPDCGPSLISGVFNEQNLSLHDKTMFEYCFDI